MADIPPSKQNSITLKLKSKDGEIFEVDKPVAMQINFVKGMLEDVDEVDGMEIPMGEVEASILAKVVEFCKFHHQQELNQTNADEIDRWEKSFVQVDKSTLFQLILVRWRLQFLYLNPAAYHVYAGAKRLTNLSHCAMFCGRCRLRTFLTSNPYWTLPAKRKILATSTCVSSETEV